MPRSRAVFLDVDGTIIDHDQRLSPAVASAVRGARAAGHLIFLCTGRSRTELPEKVVEIGFDGVISAGGGFVEHNGQLLFSHVMPEAAVSDLMGFFHRHDIEYTLQALETVYPSKGVLRRADRMRATRRPGSSESKGEADRRTRRLTYQGAPSLRGIAKATFYGDRPNTFATVRDGVDTRFTVITGTIPWLGEAGGEVSLRGMNKGTAIMQLVAALSLNLNDTIAIGDGANDLEMLDVVGVGIAMGNADVTVKSRADEITTSVDDGGVAEAFARHGLLGNLS